jgi:hypothetical protein
VILLKDVISHEACDWLVDSVSEDWDLGPEPVDGEPLWQNKMEGIHRAPYWLYSFSRVLADDVLIDKICTIYKFEPSILKKATLWPFIRKYHLDGRRVFGFHDDPTHFSATFLLNDPSNFEGGEFITQSDTTKDISVVPLEKGDCIIFRGSTFHAVKEITSGVRYSLSMFFENEVNEPNYY